MMVLRGSYKPELFLDNPDREIRLFPVLCGLTDSGSLPAGPIRVQSHARLRALQDNEDIYLLKSRRRKVALIPT